MERLDTSKYFSAAVVTLFYILLMFNMFTVTKLYIQDIAFTTMAWTQYIAIFILGFYIQKRKGFSPDAMVFTVAMLLFICAYVISYVFGEERSTSSEALSDVILVLLFITGMAQVKWEMNHIKVFAIVTVGSYLIFFLQWIHQGFPTFQYQSSIRNPNIFGALAASLMYFPLTRFSSTNNLQRLILAIGLIIGLFLVYVSSARAALLLIVISVFARIILLFSNKLFNWLFYIIIAFNLIFVVLYSWIYNSKMLVSFNLWVLEHFGKQIFSGRQEIWGQGIIHGLKKPIFGHFSGITPKDFISGTPYVHAHNQYLQLFLESGLLGLVCFVILLIAIWKTYQKHLNSELTIWSACFFLGILFYQNFEISLFGNIRAVGLFQWLIISIGLGACMFKGTGKITNEAK